jgi:hypothetical protein
MSQPTSAAYGSRSPAPLRDKLGQVVPEHLEIVFLSNMFYFLLDRLHRLRDAALMPYWPRAHLRRQDILEGVRLIEAALRDAIPYCVHADCDGRGCPKCRHAGWLPEMDRPQ